jgi:hypothetical protein
MQKLLVTAIVSAFALIQAPAFAQDKPTDKKAEPAKAEAKKAAEPAKPEAKAAEAKKAEPTKAEAKAPEAKKDEQKKPKKGGC